MLPSCSHRGLWLEGPTATQLVAKVTILLVMILVILETVVGNSLVVSSVVKFRRLRSQRCFHLLASLATADIAIAVIVMTASTVYIFLRCWPFGDFFCKFFLSSDIMCCTASILHLCLISLDRYIAVNKPLRYKLIVQPRRVAVSVAAVWAISIALSFGPVFSGIFRPAPKSSATAAAAVAAVADPSRSSAAFNSTPTTAVSTAGPPEAPQCRMVTNGVYALVSASTSFVLPLIVMTLAYARVHRIATDQCELIRQQSAQVSRQIRHETKATKTLGLILGCFYVCWLPFFVMYVICPFTSNQCAGMSEWQVDLITWIGYLNSGLNPILYCFNQREFRCAFQQLLGFRAAGASGYLRSERQSNSAAAYPVARAGRLPSNQRDQEPGRPLESSRRARRRRALEAAAALGEATGACNGRNGSEGAACKELAR